MAPPEGREAGAVMEDQGVGEGAPRGLRQQLFINYVGVFWCFSYWYSQQVLTGWWQLVSFSPRGCHLLLSEVQPTLAWVCVAEQIRKHSYISVTSGLWTPFPRIKYQPVLEFICYRRKEGKKISKPRNDTSLARVPSAATKISDGPKTRVWWPLTLLILQ